MAALWAPNARRSVPNTALTPNQQAQITHIAKQGKPHASCAKGNTARHHPSRAAPIVRMNNFIIPIPVLFARQASYLPNAVRLQHDPGIVNLVMARDKNKTTLSENKNKTNQPPFQTPRVRRVTVVRQHSSWGRCNYQSRRVPLRRCPPSSYR